MTTITPPTAAASHGDPYGAPITGVALLTDPPHQGRPAVAGVGLAVTVGLAVAVGLTVGLAVGDAVAVDVGDPAG